MGVSGVWAAFVECGMYALNGVPAKPTGVPPIEPGVMSLPLQGVSPMPLP
jgi:hypothetical protein